MREMNLNFRENFIVMKHATVKTFLFLFYLLFGIDIWSQIWRIPKYSSDFNVSHFYGLEKYIPIGFSVPLHLIDLSKLICALLIIKTILSFRVALQISNHIERKAIAICFADDYQHHYLLFILLVILAFVEIKETSENNKKETHWAIHFLLLQVLFLAKKLKLKVSIVYFWTICAKLDSSWYAGDILKTIVSPKYASYLNHLENSLNFPPQKLWAIASISTIFIEAFLAIAIILILYFSETRKIDFLKWIVVFVGISFHGMLDISGIRIGLFSYYMMGIFILVSPKALESIFLRLINFFEEKDFLKNYFMTDSLYIWSSIVLSLGLLYFIPLPGIFYGAISALIITIIGALNILPSLSHKSANSFVIVSILVLILSKYTIQLREYHVLLAQDAMRTRNMQDAIHHYKQAIEQDNYYIEGYTDLAIIMEEAKDLKGAYELNKHVMEKLEPENLKALVGVLKWHASQNEKKIGCELFTKVKERALVVSKMICHDINCHNDVRYAKEFIPRVLQHVQKKFSCKE